MFSRRIITDGESTLIKVSAEKSTSMEAWIMKDTEAPPPPPPIGGE